MVIEIKSEENICEELNEFVLLERRDEFQEVLNEKIGYLQNQAYMEGFRYAITVLEGCISVQEAG